MSANRAVVIDRWMNKDGKRTGRYGVGMCWRARLVDDQRLLAFVPMRYWFAAFARAPNRSGVCARLCHMGQIRSMSSVHPVLSRRRLRAIAGLESSVAVSCSSKGPSNAEVS
jgi:hypothetical protein